MKYATFVLIVPVLLGGCATPAFDPRQVTPDIISYNKEIQAQAADEIEAGTCSALTDMVMDYGVMRDQVRALKSAK
jgi:hypothetical protein